MSQAAVLATTCFYALMLAWTMPGLLGPDRAPCVVLALPVLLVRRLPAAVFAAVLGESVLGDIFGARPSIVFVLLVALGGYLAVRRPKAAAVGSVAAVAAAFVNDTHVPGETVERRGPVGRGARVVVRGRVGLRGGVSQTP